jgi:hypothetical protein
MNAAEPPGRRFPRPALMALTFAILGSACMSYYYFCLFMPRVREAQALVNLAGGYAFGQDFYPVWLTLHKCMRESCDPYSVEMTREIQQGLFGRTLNSRNPSDPPSDYRTFAYPAFTDLLLWPAAEFPFAPVSVVFALVLAALTLASVVVWTKALCWHPRPLLLVAIMLLVLCSYPVLEGLYVEQLGLLVGFFLAVAVLALQRGRLFLAGTMMALTTIKPQMTLPVLFYLLVWSSQKWRERGRFWVGLLSTILVLAIAPTLVWPHWIKSWASVVVGYHHYAKPPLINEILTTAVGGNVSRPASLAGIALLVLLSGILSWKRRAIASSSIQFWLTLSFTLCITAVALLPSQGFHDQVIVLPGIFLVSHRWKDLRSNWVSKVFLATGTGILLWPWLAAIALIGLRPLLTQQDFYSKAVFVLPLRTAAVFPFVLLGVLAVGLRRIPASMQA